MPSTLGPAHAAGNVRTSELCRAAARELGARAHAELRVDVRQVARDGALAEEERRGDLAVRLPLRDEHRDPALGLRQAVLDGVRPPIRPSSARALSAQSGAPSASKPASAASIVSRASARCLARRSVAPSASSVRARPKGSADCACSRTASSKLAEAPSRSPRAASSRPRDRRAGSRAPGAVEPLAPRPPTSSRTGRPRRARRRRAGPRKVAELQPLSRLEHELGASARFRASRAADERRAASPSESSSKPRIRRSPHRDAMSIASGPPGRAPCCGAALRRLGRGAPR